MVAGPGEFQPELARHVARLRPTRSVVNINIRSLTPLLRLRPLSGRYSNLEPTQPWVAEIVIARLDKSGGASG